MDPSPRVTRPTQVTRLSSRAHRPGPPRSRHGPAERVDQVLPSSTRPAQLAPRCSRPSHPFCHPPGFVERPNRLSQGNPPTCGRWTVGRLAKGVRARRDGGSLAGWPMDLRADVLPEVVNPVRAPQSARSRSHPACPTFAPQPATLTADAPGAPTNDAAIPDAPGPPSFTVALPHRGMDAPPSPPVPPGEAWSSPGAPGGRHAVGGECKTGPEGRAGR